LTRRVTWAKPFVDYAVTEGGQNIQARRAGLGDAEEFDGVPISVWRAKLAGMLRGRKGTSVPDPFRRGADVPQACLTDAAGERCTRLLEFERLELKPGEPKTVTVKADPRLLARFDGKDRVGRSGASPKEPIASLGGSASGLGC